MKLEKISIHNYIATREVELKPKAPVTLICGNNEAGKSSLCEAIKHAFTGQSTRVSLKKDFKFLVNDSASDKVGYALFEYDGGKQAAITLPNGTHEIKEELHSALPYVLDPELFPSLSDDDRRRFILGLNQDEENHEFVTKTLIDKGCDKSKAFEISPFLSMGFDGAHKEALNKSREAKSAWRATTGENYGHQKADIWVAPKAEIDPTLEEGTRGELLGLDKAIEETSSAIGAGQAVINGAKANDSELSRLRDSAGKINRITENLAIDRNELAMWLVNLEDAKFHAGQVGGTECVCPECDAELVFQHGVLEKRGEFKRDEEKASKVLGYQKTVEMFQRAVANGERDLKDAEYAAAKLAELEKADADVPPVDEESMKQLSEKLGELKSNRKTIQEKLSKITEGIRQNQEADEKTTKAKQFHKEAQEWDQIAGFLAPDGIPSERLSVVLKLINDRLKISSVATGWGTVIITNDMTITCNTRRYSLLSVSAKWRVNAMIAEAISHVTGLKFLILDGFDVLSPQGRGQLIKWVDDLAIDHEIDTLIMLATLKALPTVLPPSFECHWIESGAISEGPAAKKAA